MYLPISIYLVNISTYTIVIVDNHAADTKNHQIKPVCAWYKLYFLYLIFMLALWRSPRHHWSEKRCKTKNNSLEKMPFSTKTLDIPGRMIGDV